MTQETLFKALGEIDENFIEEAAKPPKKPIVWLKIATVAACVAVIAVGVWTARPSAKPRRDDPLFVTPEAAVVVTPSTTQSPSETIASQNKTTMVVTLPDGTERTIAYYPEVAEEFIVTRAPQSGLTDYVRAPYPGEVWIDMFAEPIIKQDNNGLALYWMAIYLSDKDGKPIFDAARIREHADALCEKGYVIYLYEREEVPVIGGLFSAKQLLSFPSDDQYGYLIDFAYMDRSECTPKNTPQQ